METFFLVLAISGIVIQALLLLLALFGPGLPYRIASPPPERSDEKDFARIVGIISGAMPHSDTAVEVLTNGEVFYEAELEAIRNAKSFISVEAYIFQKGEIASRFVEALAERAAAGVEVRLLMDAVGSFATFRRHFKPLLKAGGQVEWYMPLRWYNLLSYNHRTHRELLVVDGEVGFLGGAGVGDHWYRRIKKRSRWRDTMFRVRGSVVASLTAICAENWLEATGDLLIGPKYYPVCPPAGKISSMLVESTPGHGRATRARMLFQTLLHSATRSIHITTPYFLPDWSVRKELLNAVDRGVEVKVIVPGKHHDHLLTRRSSRRIYGELLQHGVRIYEYRPAMIHTKSLVVDGIWSVVGSTNFDHRSFGINEEVNLAVLDEGFTARLEEDFQKDLSESRNISYKTWQKRSPLERIHEWLGWVVEKQE